MTIILCSINNMTPNKEVDSFSTETQQKCCYSSHSARLLQFKLLGSKNNVSCQRIQYNDPGHSLNIYCLSRDYIPRGAPLYGLCRYVQPHRVPFWVILGWKRHLFWPFWSEIGLFYTPAWHCLFTRNYFFSSLATNFLPFIKCLHKWKPFFVSYSPLLEPCTNFRGLEWVMDFWRRFEIGFKLQCLGSPPKMSWSTPYPLHTTMLLYLLGRSFAVPYLQCSCS